MTRKAFYVDLGKTPQKFENTVMVTGFMGFGLVGYITVDFLVNKLKPEKIGYIVTRLMPDQVSYSEERGLELPFEVYYLKREEGKSLVILHNRWIPHPLDRFAYARFVVKWAKRRNVEALYAFGGLDNSYKEEPSERLRWVKTSWYQGPLPEAKPMKGGLKVVGPLAHLLEAAEIWRLPALALLPFCESMRQDPRASAIGLEEFSKLVGLELDTKELIEKAEQIEKELETLRQMMMSTATSGRESHYM